MVHIPGEIVLNILADECISKPDLKNLRLASKWTCKFATGLLFSRIYISKLKSDRESFFNIAARPHLAAAVQTVTWLEMLEDETSFTHVEPGSEDQDVVDVNLFSLLRPLARALFWLPFEEHLVRSEENHQGPSTVPDINEEARERATMRNIRKTERQRTEAIQTFTPHFFAALDNMPRLRELTSQPMPPRREFVKPFGLSPSQYPFTSQMFLRTMSKRGLQRNDGFCTFLIPYMAHRANLHTLEPITRLRLVDESNWTCTGRFDETFVKSFDNLTHLDLCVSSFLEASQFVWLGQCLKAATPLEEVRLCFERSRVCSGHTWNFFPYLFPDDGIYSSLRTLILVEMPSTRAVFHLIKKVASSLKILRYENTPVTLELLQMLSKVPELRLEQFMVISDRGPWDRDDDWDLTGLLLREETVLGVLDGTITNFFHRWPPKDRDFHIYTHYTGPPLREPSFFDSNHRVLNQDRIDYIQLREWGHPDIEEAESSDADYDTEGPEDSDADPEGPSPDPDYYDDGEVDIKEDGGSEQDDDDGDVDMTDTDDLSETDDELMDFYANLLETSDGSQIVDSTSTGD
ncbi:hypothetical protein T069G_06488 [Trichoderma breve]|uniref:F-box domain-containing protein n=1 Tax=Trichoderma breve TaxID=2034170 RepID=A0A9W9BEQ5_9HYPO|nr:hypothetical protein T069G_06488 [Trichoderma breve]KAJ4858221.1 hypothetical protein T069G_06488 [Trichoderma breve]